MRTTASHLLTWELWQMNDAHIFNESDIGKTFVANEMNIPPPTWFGKYYLPYVIVSDEIFALKRWLMKPYPGKICDTAIQKFVLGQ